MCTCPRNAGRYLFVPRAEACGASFSEKRCSASLALTALLAATALTTLLSAALAGFWSLLAGLLVRILLAALAALLSATLILLVHEFLQYWFACCVGNPLKRVRR